MQRIIRCVLGGVLLFGATLLTPSTAQAVDACTVPIVDEANVLDDARIRTEAKKLEDLGAIVRIRSFNTAPLGSLDAYREAQVKACPSWRGADGQPAGKLAVFTFTVEDRKSNVFTGPDWADKMDSQVNRIRNEVMNPRLAEQRYTDGVVDAMAKTHEVISGEESGISGKTIRLILGIIGIIVALGGAVFGLLYWRRRVIERREAQADAQDAYDDAAEALSKIDTLRVQMVGVSVDKATMGLEEETTDRLRQQFKAANDLVTVALQANGTLSDNRSMSLDDKHSRVEYDEIAKENSEVAEAANEAAKALDAVEVSCAEVEQMIATMDSAAVTLRDQATALIDRKVELQTDGYKVALDDFFTELDRNITAIFKFTEADTPGKALDERVVAEALVAKIEGQLTWLSKIRGDLQNRHRELNERRLGLSRETEVAAETYKCLEEDYNEVLFQDLKQHVPGNHSMLQEVEQLLDVAVPAMSMETQDWSRATDLLNEVSDLCERAQQNCATVSARERELVQLAVRTVADAGALPGKASTAQAKAASYTKGSQDGYRNTLAGLKQSAEQLKARVHQNKPDFRTLARECSNLESEIDSTLSSARREHERVEAEERAERERQRQAAAAAAAAVAAASNPVGGGSGTYGGGSNASGSY